MSETVNPSIYTTKMSVSTTNTDFSIGSLSVGLVFLLDSLTRRKIFGKMQIESVVYWIIVFSFLIRSINYNQL